MAAVVEGHFRADDELHTDVHRALVRTNHAVETIAIGECEGVHTKAAAGVYVLLRRTRSF